MFTYLLCLCSGQILGLDRAGRQGRRREVRAALYLAGAPVPQLEPGATRQLVAWPGLRDDGALVGAVVRLALYGKALLRL